MTELTARDQSMIDQAWEIHRDALPVAWRRRRKGTIGDGGWIMCPLKPERDREFELQPLYAAPQPATVQADALDSIYWKEKYYALAKATGGPV